jgi:hypothetical protein
MLRTLTAYSLIFMLAVNSLLSAVGGAGLCLQALDHGHFSFGSNPLATDDCHSSKTDLLPRERQKAGKSVSTKV